MPGWGWLLVGVAIGLAIGAVLALAYAKLGQGVS